MSRTCPKCFTVDEVTQRRSVDGLAANDRLVRVYGKATGAWSYNGEVTYWALPPGPPTTNTLTWQQFATVAGIDPRRLG